MPITKHNFTVRSVEELADTLRKAFEIAAEGRPGPVLVDVPKDVQVATYDFEPQGIVEKKPLPKANQSQIDAGLYLSGAGYGEGLGTGSVLTAQKKRPLPVH